MLIVLFGGGVPSKATTPALEASDTTLKTGRVGLGSFDETGQFRNVIVTGF
jgi:hypothetical protein